jgi:hypothetical protein
MKKVFLALILTIFLTLPAFSQERAEEALIVTTYYPSPYGIYNELRLFPQPAKDDSLCTAENEGLMYYNQDEDRVEICRGGVWESLGGGWWTSDNGQDIYNTNTGNVGIGTENPQAKLDVAGRIRASGGVMVGTEPDSACGYNQKGLMRYNERVLWEGRTLKQLQYCDGESWRIVSSPGNIVGGGITFTIFSICVPGFGGSCLSSWGAATCGSSGNPVLTCPEGSTPRLTGSSMIFGLFCHYICSQD